jgi:hypothetical protein
MDLHLESIGFICIVTEMLSFTWFENCRRANISQCRSMLIQFLKAQRGSQSAAQMIYYASICIRRSLGIRLFKQNQNRPLRAHVMSERIFRTIWSIAASCFSPPEPGLLGSPVHVRRCIWTLVACRMNAHAYLGALRALLSDFTDLYGVCVHPREGVCVALQLVHSVPEQLGRCSIVLYASTDLS